MRLRYLSSSERQNKNNILSVFTSRYKPQYFYWEFIIFIRRICIAMFSVTSINDNWTVAFIIIMFIFLFFQYQCQPFIINAANKMELYYYRV